MKASPATGAVGDGGDFADQFREANQRLLVQRCRLVAVVGVPVYLLFFWLDVSLAPQLWEWALAVRLSGAGVIVFVGAATYSRPGVRWLVPLSIVGYIAIALSLVAMTPALGGFASNYYVGIMLIMFFAGLLMPWHLSATLPFCGTVVSSYFLLNASLFGVTHEALAPMLYLSGTAFFTALATETSWRVRRADLDMRLRLEALNIELRALDETKSRFFANLSHELRTPLTLIIGALRDAERQLVGAARLRAGTGLRNASHLLSLVNDLLDLTKLEGSERVLNKEVLDVAALVRRVAANFQSSGARKRLRVVDADEQVVIEADPKLMTKVIYNLLSNALKFSVEARAPVCISVERAEETVSIVVQDGGIGIPADMLESIFDRFSQVDARANRRYEGTGIGLALVREAVQAHSGEVTVDSTLGEGSTFTVRLPRGPSTALPTSLDVSPEPLPAASRASEPPDEAGRVACNTLLSTVGTARAPLILVAEDNADLRTYLHDLLTRDYRLIVCPDGAAAIDMYRRYTPDVVLTDLMMPVVDGQGVIKAVREDTAAVQTPVIVLTADIAPETRAALLEQGATDFIGKPFEENELFARVRVALRLRQQEQRLDAMAHEDGLTGIANRREFDRRLNEAWYSAIAAGQPLSLLICDLDFFKRFNDRHGHLAGDDCLRRVAEVISSALFRGADLAARYGGEEFAVLLPATGAEGAAAVAQRIVAEVRALGVPHAPSDVADGVTVSVGGFTMWPEETASADMLASQADKQLYRAKQRGRDQAQLAVAKGLSTE